MQIIKIYGKDSNLKYKNKNVFKTIDDFFKKYPLEYRCLYDKNLETLEIFKCDELFNEYASGEYHEDANIILYTDINCLGHELFHMASYDEEKGVAAIEGKLDIEQGMIEGMTEYAYMSAFGLSHSKSDYGFEVFVVKMLEDIPNLFKYYFIPSHHEFIKLFPNKKDIYNLLFAVDKYHEKSLDYLDCLYGNGEISSQDILVIKKSIKQIINNLINIELSLTRDSSELKKYREKFMDLIGSRDISYIISDFFPKYYRYAEMQVKNRILKR